MKYQLVLQWPASSIKDYDTVIDIEETLEDSLDNGSEVDGHDAGSGQMNIFIHTNNPRVCFKAIQASIGTRDFWVDARVAYRESQGSSYTVLWPEDSFEFEIF